MSDDEGGDELSEAERKLERLIGPISLRKHSVDLERVQRIHLGIDNEPMEFNETTLAKMIEDVADNCEENEAFTLIAIAAALRGSDSNHRLILKQRKPGRWESPTEHEAHHAQIFSWLHTLANREISGEKTEAAVAWIADRWGVSRASVFAGVKEAEEFLRSGSQIFPGNANFKNPRPDKTRNT
jgi:predicted 3-demethylubiquinone-9 3-methyltransferase (glyoxalase superfamily)